MVSLGKVTAPKPVNLPSQRYASIVHRMRLLAVRTTRLYCCWCLQAGEPRHGPLRQLGVQASCSFWLQCLLPAPRSTVLWLALGLIST